MLWARLAFALPVVLVTLSVAFQLVAAAGWPLPTPPCLPGDC